ncbi:MAG TPA: DUF3515 domain-containing protein [Pseudonocardia sp.]|nr:DUF3515 domain-containing protein [Pseudonocardia sp.]
MPDRRPSPPLVLALALPLLLAVAVAVAGIVTRGATDPVPDTGPLAVVPVEAPEAGSARCAALLAALPAQLPAADGPLASRPLAEPAPAGVRAWAAVPGPVVLRCGLSRPPELEPASALLQVNGVQWLELDDGVPDPAVTSYVAVDRPVYVALTAPVGSGSGPLQAVSDAVRATLPATEIAAR